MDGVVPPRPPIAAAQCATPQREEPVCPRTRWGVALHQHAPGRKIDIVIVQCQSSAPPTV